MIDPDLLKTVQKELREGGMPIKLRAPDGEKDHDLLKLYNDMAEQAGKTHLPLAICKGAKDCFYYVLNEHQSIVVLAEDVLRKRGPDAASAVIAHEFGHDTPQQIARTLKKDEVMSHAYDRAIAAQFNPDVEEFRAATAMYRRAKATVRRFDAVDEFAADRSAAKIVPPEVMAQTLEHDIKHELRYNKGAREELYPGQTAKEARRSFETDLAGKSGKGSVFVTRIQSLRAKAKDDNQEL